MVSIRNIFLLLLLLVASLSNNAMASGTEDVDTIITRMMANIHPQRDSLIKVEIYECNEEVVPCSEEQKSGLTRANIYIAGANKNADKPPKTLIHFIYPEDVKNNLILHADGQIWMQFPDTKSPIRIPPEQNVLGDVDVGSLLDIDYRWGYAKEIIESSDQSWGIHLTDEEGGVTNYMIAKSSYIPQSASIFASSGRIMRDLVFSDIGNIGDRESYRQIYVYSKLLKKKSYTVIHYISEEPFVLSKKVLFPRQLKNFTKRIDK